MAKKSSKKTEKSDAKRGRPLKPIDVSGKGKQKEPRENSKRGNILRLCSRANGATLDELSEFTKRPREAVMILAKHYGKSFKQDGNRIKLS